MIEKKLRSPFHTAGRSAPTDCTNRRKAGRQLPEKLLSTVRIHVSFRCSTVRRIGNAGGGHGVRRSKWKIRHATSRICGRRDGIRRASCRIPKNEKFEEIE